MKLKELFETNDISENTEAAFQSAFRKVVDKLGFENLSPMFDSSSTAYGLKTFLNADKILLSLLPEDDDDFIGIVGKNGNQIYYVGKSGRGKKINKASVSELINKSDAVGILNV